MHFKRPIVSSLYGCILVFSFTSDVSCKLKPVQAWAEKFGEDLWSVGKLITNKQYLHEAYKGDTIVPIDGESTIRTMAASLGKIIQTKIDALRKIVAQAEKLSFELEQDMSDEYLKYLKTNFSFKNSKKLPDDINNSLFTDVNFFNARVNTNFSTVHVATNVYERGNETIKAIKWSEQLDNIFMHNYMSDSSLTWQYFGSSTGIMRVYPGIAWVPNGDNELSTVDLYDCRMRPWYIGAAVSPKDMIILVDNSGSMMGQKREIARHVINTILDTLAPNDFVNVLRFNTTADSVVTCFADKLVQATSENVRELKYGVEKMEPDSGIADFKVAFVKAFEILELHRTMRKAAMCNQAIMLVTDGTSDNQKQIFEKYNWMNSTEPPFPVRVFTYGIGKDGTDNRQIKWMACANQGYYVQLNTMAEVREQILKYIDVMSRPLVLQGTHIDSWTATYADRIDTKYSDWLWEQEQNKQQKLHSVAYRENRERYLAPQSQKCRDFAQHIKALDQNQDYRFQRYNFMTTVSLPAFDQRRSTNSSNSNVGNNLLGVAATDIPISEFKKVLSAFRLGVNNYGFIVDNNGFVILHPDLRPVFHSILKPDYNNVDFLEVELAGQGNPPDDVESQLLDDDDVSSARFAADRRNTVVDEHDVNCRNFSEYFIYFRDMIINQTTTRYHSNVKFHYDNMRRASTCNREYYMHGIEGSPFTAIIALSDSATHTVAPPTNIHFGKTAGPASYFDAANWRIHPEWFYCKYNYSNEHTRNFSSPENQLLHFLDSANFNKQQQQQQNSNHRTAGKPPVRSKIDELSAHCNMELLQTLIYDANITKYWQEQTSMQDVPASTVASLKDNGVVNVFIATRSGLTRWNDYNDSDATTTTDTSSTSWSFVSSDGVEGDGGRNNKAIDELWYKRAVHLNFQQPDSFVYSVPIEPFDRPTTDSSDVLVTASHAILIRRKAAVATVGFQFKQSILDSILRKAIPCPSQSLLSKHKQQPRASCEEEFLKWREYYVLDDNGYVVAAEKKRRIGGFFGSIYGSVMDDLIDRAVYKPITVYDYQGVCFFTPPTPNNNQPLSGAANSFPYSSSVRCWLFIVPMEMKNLLFTLISWSFRVCQQLMDLKWLLSPILSTALQYYAQPNHHGVRAESALRLQCSADGWTVEGEHEPDEHEREQLDELVKKSNYYPAIRHLIVLNRTRMQPCDRRADLYQLVLNTPPLSTKLIPKDDDDRDQSWTFARIPHTNLVLVVMDKRQIGNLPDRKFDTTPIEVKHQTNDAATASTSPVCHKVKYNWFSRRRVKYCQKQHSQEKYIQMCGKGSIAQLANSCYYILAILLLVNSSSHIRLFL